MAVIAYTSKCYLCNTENLLITNLLITSYWHSQSFYEAGALTSLFAICLQP